MQQCDDGETIYQVTKKVEILKKMNFHLQESPSPLVGFFHPRRKTINKLLNSFFVLGFIMKRRDCFYCPKVNGGLW